jgi:hypothetical protein
MTEEVKKTVPGQAEAAAAASAQAEAIKRAARQAAKTKVAPQTIERVKVRVLPNGDGKISMGVHIAGVGEAHYERGEVIPNVLKDTAQDLEARGFAEIVA